MKRWLLAVAMISACGTTNPLSEVPLLDGPNDIAFACYGPVKDTDLVAAQPLAACDTHWLGPDGAPSSSTRSTGPTYFSLVLEGAPGRLAVVEQILTRNEAEGDPPSGTIAAITVDSDPLTPTKNSIPIGNLPVALDIEPTGCFAFSANYGSCDLSRLEVAAVVGRDVTPVLQQVSIKNGMGQRIAARPRALVAVPRAPGMPGACPATPMATDLFYVALPNCNLVAGVEAATGTIREAIRFDDSGTGTVLADGDLAALSCPVECADEMAAPGGMMSQTAARPTTIDLRMEVGVPVLTIGSQNSSRLNRIELGTDGRLADGAVVTALDLEGSVGVTRVRTTDLLFLGNGMLQEERFAYAIATDRTVRVANFRLNRECDTQVDPRELLGENNVEQLACTSIGRTRRAGARGPGIQLPNEAVPLDVAFSHQEKENDADTFAGDFGFVTASDGKAYIVNVDDDSYKNVHEPGDPLNSMIPLAVAHQLRDGGASRGDSLISGAPCVSPNVDGGATVFGPRLAPVSGASGPGNDRPLITLNSDYANGEDETVLFPRPAQIACANVVAGETVPVAEMSYLAPVAVRAAAFPDIMSVFQALTSIGRLAESWSVTWEGPLSVETRRGRLLSDGGFRLEDPAAGLCRIGTVPGDIITIVGCNPVLQGADCGVDESCFVHPASPANVHTGVCVPKGSEDVLADTCAKFMPTFRQYTAGTDLQSGRVTLSERPRVLRTNPLDGCMNDTECTTYYQEERGLRLHQHPANRVPVDGELVPTWSCRDHDSQGGTPNRCVMTCADDNGCEDGYVCSNGQCVSGQVPPVECQAALQSFMVSGGDSLIVRGNLSGYLHNRGVTDPMNPACTDLPNTDPAFHRLNVGRIRLTGNNACAGPTPESPCTEAFATHIERRNVWSPSDAQCTNPSPELVTRTNVPSIRFENRAFMFHIVDPSTTGDMRCIGDGAGTLRPFSPVFPGYSIRLDLAGAFLPLAVGDAASEEFDAHYPVTIKNGPLGRLWVVDEAEYIRSNGTLYVLSPEAADFGVLPVR